MKLKAHIFVCTNERPAGHPRGCCMNHKSDNLVQLLKKELARAGLSTEVRAQKAGCLDVCEYGPALVVYPDQVWYGGVKPEDISEIVQSHLKDGRVVERLRIPGK
ncbi:(2Fe-2S) ferredoxin domain-containing protein [bacterium]|nr:(2Fe-2S) ferredoxin domain-containing protein [bacterium]